MQVQDHALLQCTPQVLPHVYVGASTVQRLLSVLDFWHVHCGGSRDANKDALSGALVLLHGTLQQVKTLHKQGDMWRVELWRRQQQPSAAQPWLVHAQELQEMSLVAQSVESQAALCAEYTHAAMGGAAVPITADKVMHVTLMVMRYRRAAERVERALAAMSHRQSNFAMLHQAAVDEVTKALTQQLSQQEADYLGSLMKSLQNGALHSVNSNHAPAAYQQQATHQPPGHYAPPYAPAAVPYPGAPQHQAPHNYAPQHQQHQQVLQRHASEQLADGGTLQPHLQGRQSSGPGMFGIQPEQTHTTTSFAAQPATSGQLPNADQPYAAANGGGVASGSIARNHDRATRKLQQAATTSQLHATDQISPFAHQQDVAGASNDEPGKNSTAMEQPVAEGRQRTTECPAFPFPVGDYKLAAALPDYLLEAMQLLLSPPHVLVGEDMQLDLSIAAADAGPDAQHVGPRERASAKDVQPAADGVAKVRTVAAPSVHVKEEVQDDLEEYLEQFVLEPQPAASERSQEQPAVVMQPAVAQLDTSNTHAAAANGTALAQQGLTKAAPAATKAQGKAIQGRVTPHQQEQQQQFIPAKVEPEDQPVLQARKQSPGRHRHSSRSSSRASSRSSSRSSRSSRSYSSSSSDRSRRSRSRSISRSRSPARSSGRHHKRKRGHSSSSCSRSPSRSRSPADRGRSKSKPRSLSRGRRSRTSSRHRSRSRHRRNWSRDAGMGARRWRHSRSPSRESRRFVRGPYVPRVRSPGSPGFRMGPPPPGWSPGRRPPNSPMDDIRLGPAAPVALRPTADGRLIMDGGVGGVSSSEGEHSSQEEEEEEGVFRTKKRWKMPPPRAGIPKFCPRMEHIERWDPVNDPDPLFVKASRRGSPPRPYLGRPLSPSRPGPYGVPRSPPRSGMLGGYSPPLGRRDMPSPRWRDGEPWHLRDGGRGRSPPPRSMGAFNRGPSPPRLGYRGSPPRGLPYGARSPRLGGYDRSPSRVYAGFDKERSPPRSYGGFDKRPVAGFDRDGDMGSAYDRGHDLGPGGDRGPTVHEIKARLQRERALGRSSGQSSGWR